AYDQNVSEEKMATFGAEKVELDYLLENSDIISLNACITDTSLHMLNKDKFNKMKDGVLIANTARGELVVENDLVEALENGKVKAYATDVFETEPILEENPLKNFEYNILTPHIGAYTDLSLKAMGDKCVKDIELMVNGKEPVEIVNKGVLPK